MWIIHKLGLLQVQVSCFYIQLDAYSHIGLGFIVISILHSGFIFAAPTCRQRHFSLHVERKSYLAKRGREENQPWLRTTMFSRPCVWSQACLVYFTTLCGKHSKWPREFIPSGGVVFQIPLLCSNILRKGLDTSGWGDIAIPYSQVGTLSVFLQPSSMKRFPRFICFFSGYPGPRSFPSSEPGIKVSPSPFTSAQIFNPPFSTPT